ncbi:MAG TPA: hypothetical protein VGD40_01270 [Chryseosolibacter sp.]
MLPKLLLTHGLKLCSRVLQSCALRLHFLARGLERISLLTPEERAILQRNAKFKDKHKGKRAFVIVTGPSLANQDISWLGDEVTFVVSGFYKHESVKVWQPTYYCIADAYFFNGKPDSLKFFDNLKTVITKSIFFIPLFRGYAANKRHGLLPQDQTFYIANAGLPNHKIDMTGVVQSFQSVSAFALAQAIYMGCSPIYLMGFDHDWLANRGMDKHFYKDSIVQGTPGSTKPLSALKSYDEDVRTVLTLWKNYRALDYIARKRNIKIYNATGGGYLDVFEYARFEDLKKNNAYEASHKSA